MSVRIPQLVPRIVSTYQAAITVLVIQGTGSQELQLVMVCMFFLRISFIQWKVFSTKQEAIFYGRHFL